MYAGLHAQLHLHVHNYIYMCTVTYNYVEIHQKKKGGGVSSNAYMHDVHSVSMQTQTGSV